MREEKRQPGSRDSKRRQKKKEKERYKNRQSVTQRKGETNLSRTDAELGKTNKTQKRQAKQNIRKMKHAWKTENNKELTPNGKIRRK